MLYDYSNKGLPLFAKRQATQGQRYDEECRKQNENGFFFRIRLKIPSFHSRPSFSFSHLSTATGPQNVKIGKLQKWQVTKLNFDFVELTVSSFHKFLRNDYADYPDSSDSLFSDYF